MGKKKNEKKWNKCKKWAPEFWFSNSQTQQKKHVLEVCFFFCFHSSSWFQWLVPLLLIVGFSEPLRLRGAEWHTHTWETTSHTQDLKTLEWDSSAVTKTLKFLHLIDSWRSAHFFNTFPSFQTRQSNSLGRLFNPSYPPTNFFCL